MSDAPITAIEPGPEYGIFHYTDKDGWNAIRSQVVWQFKASPPKALDRPAGAYFTDLEPSAANLRVLYKKLRVPRRKQDYVFWFSGREGLTQLNEGKGRDKRIFYSPVDYPVAQERQEYAGQTAAIQERFA